MSVEVINVQYQDGYVDVVLNGVSIGIHTQYKDIHDRIFTASLKHQCPRILMDLSNVHYVPSVLLEHNTALDLVARRMGHPFPVRMTVVMPAQNQEGNLHLRNTASNRGVSVEVFYSREDAIAWLMQHDLYMHDASSPLPEHFEMLLDSYQKSAGDEPETLS